MILGCSATKLQNDEPLPAVIRYDGPVYRVFQSYLRESRWPTNLSVGVLSAKYGLIGGLTHIHDYDLRMNRGMALKHRERSTQTLVEWSKGHKNISFVLGKDYLPALNLDALSKTKNINVLEGGIGYKLSQLHNLLRDQRSEARTTELIQNTNRPLYFLPDWDDMLDAEYDFIGDSFSHPERAKRREVHCIEAMKPKRLCDGVLVSLAQLQGTKGILKKFDQTDMASLSPQSIKKKYGLSRNQIAFGDCGAFSYVNEPSPTISVEQAAALYQLYGFDMGASVDHIPVPVVGTPSGKKELSISARRRRIDITKRNAERFIEHHRDRKYTFIPVGVIQALSPRNYIRQLHEYIEMGYRHIAFGGLVPRSDKEIVEILRALNKARKDCPATINDSLWVHLFGVFRPKIQTEIRKAGVSSFDSATYFRKAWLRSDQNYLGADGKWYAAIRVPSTSDPRTLKRLAGSGVPLKELQRLEKNALKGLHEYADGNRSIGWTLRAIQQYDFLLSRSDDHSENLLESYKRTLESRIWEKCQCSICSSVGVDALIFRGYNRNKRRGTHNTLMLYNRLSESK